MYIAMEYIPTGDMSKTFVNRYRWNEYDTRAVVEQVLQGLVVMHKRGITHHGLKPEVWTFPRLKYSYQNLTVSRTYFSTFQRMRLISG